MISPIAQRELRVASKRPGTWGLRVVFALGPILFLLYQLLSPDGFNPATAGKGLFEFLISVAFAYCVIASLANSFDAISEERREGTLGLLFLTPLRGRDIILGKLTSSLTKTLPAVLTVLPLTGIPLLMGGVSGWMFFNSILVLLNTVFVISALSLAVSGGSNASGSSLIAGLGMISLLMLGVVPALALPILVLAWGRFKGRTVVLIITGLLNPAIYVWSLAQSQLGFNLSGGAPWVHLGLALSDVPLSDPKLLASAGINHAIGWLFLLAAYRTTSITWRDGSDPVQEVVTFQRRVRRRNRNPIIHATPWMRRVIWLSLIIMLGTHLFGPYYAALLLRPGAQFYLGLNILFTVAHAVPALIAALLASQLFLHGRRDGSLEILLFTPSPRMALIREVRRKVLQFFLTPFIVYCVVVLATNLFGIMVNDGPILHIGLTAVSLALHVPEFLALIWLSLWLSWTLKRPGPTPVVAWLTVILLPMIVYHASVFLVISLHPWLHIGMPAHFPLMTRIVVLLIIWYVAHRQLKKTFLSGQTPGLIGARPYL